MFITTEFVSLHITKEFAEISEIVFKNSDRRTDLDKAYHQLIRVVFENVERMAVEHQKTPHAVVMMGRSVKSIKDFLVS